jgi:hypothetical protein
VRGAESPDEGTEVGVAELGGQVGEAGLAISLELIFQVADLGRECLIFKKTLPKLHNNAGDGKTSQRTRYPTEF